MWTLCVLCFLRRKLVLSLIFIFSLTYCLLSFYIINNKQNLMYKPNEDRMMIRRVKEFVWHENKTETSSCRNSIQGKLMIADDKGYVCTRDLVLNNGCCTTSSNSIQYSCETCNEQGCCVTYEFCVSCCLNPQKKEFLEKILNIESSTYHHKNILFASVSDPWELCLSTCRTNSQSVQHENTYINPSTKYCYSNRNDNQNLQE